MNLDGLKKLEAISTLEVRVIRNLTGYKTNLLLDGEEVNTNDVLKALYPDLFKVWVEHRNACITKHVASTLEGYATFYFNFNIGEVPLNFEIQSMDVEAGKEHLVVLERLQKIVDVIDTYIKDFKDVDYTVPLTIK